MKRYLLSLTLLSIACISNAQSFNGPESVEFDPVNNRYIVSNSSNGTLQSVIPGQAPTLFTSDVSGPYGLAEYNGVIYVCDAGYVKGYSLTTAQPVFSVNLSGGFLNGICSDGNGTLYVTDFSAQQIISVDIAAQTFEVVVDDTGVTPNGILFDEDQNRLIFATWSSSAQLIEVNTTTFALTPKITTTLSNIDGVVMDRCGNFFVSEWGSNKIYKIDADFGAPVAVFSQGISAPADIYFNKLNDTLAVPNSSANTVLFFSADFCTDFTSLPENENGLFDIIALPESIQLIWKNIENPIAEVSVTDMSGKLIRRLQFSDLESNTYSIPTGGWESGVYIVSFNAGGQSFVKKVFVR